MANTRTRYHWTTDQKQLMASLYAEGYGFSDIAIMVGGGTRETIRYHLKRAGVQFRGPGMRTAVAKAKSSGFNHHNWKGVVKRRGYRYVYSPGHPRHDKDGYYPEHRLVVERCLQRDDPRHPGLMDDGSLNRAWVVHHKNGDKSDNRPENLEPIRHFQHHPFLQYEQENTMLRRILDEFGISYPKSIF